ncbi:MAG TPA: hypothetical protein VNT60_06730 [Deinococcales bacterium]|nr:hypothetical protein [Deinococcales bacterium]
MTGPGGASAAAVLADLLAQPMGGADEAEFSVYLEDAGGDCGAGFAAAVADVTTALGEPDLSARTGEGPEIPEWLWATDTAVAAWRLADRVAAVRLEDPGGGLPCAVVVSVRRR